MACIGHRTTSVPSGRVAAPSACTRRPHPSRRPPRARPQRHGGGRGDARPGPHWIWDVRSFWAEQRIAMGALRRWIAGGARVRSIEHRAGRQARGLVTLTAAAQRTLGERHGPALLTNAAVDPDVRRAGAVPVLAATGPRPDRPHAQRQPEPLLRRAHDDPLAATRCERRRPTELVVLAPGATTWDAELRCGGVNPRSVEYAQIPVEIAAAHAGLSVCRADAGPSLQAAVPTKIAEFLASGRPVVVNRGLGDFDELLPGSGAGVVLDRAGDDAIERAARELLMLLASPDTPASCRAFAAAHFDLDVGIVRLVEVYRRAVASG